MCCRSVLVVAVVVLAGFVKAENALEFVERRTAEILKIDPSQVGEWNHEKIGRADV